MIALAACITSLLVVASAQATTATLDGEFVADHVSAHLTSLMCNQLGDSTLTFEKTADAQGPFTGTYTETGTVTLGPQTDPIPNAPGQFRARITAYHAEFTITGPQGNVTGTKDLVPNPTPENSYGGCDSAAAQIIASELVYHANLPGGVSEGGASWSNFNSYTVVPDPNPSGFEWRSAFYPQVATTGDTTPPQLTVPGTISAAAEDANGAHVTYSVSAQDDTDPNPSTQCDVPSGGVFPIGTTTVHCTARDASGNATTKSFDVVVSDQHAPAITVPATITMPADDRNGAHVTYSVSANDDVDSNPSLACDPPSGSLFAVGTTTVHCTATDAAGNHSSKSFNVVIEGATDSDGDGLSDVIEIWLHCNPHNADSDGDGVSDYLEVILGTDPNKADSDGDGVGDYQYLYNIYYHLCGCGPDDDADHDGVATWIELKYHMNPGGITDDPSGGGYSSDIEYLWHLCGCRPEDETGDGVPEMVKKYWGGGGILEIIHACGCHPWEDPNGGGGIWRDFRFVGGPGGDDSDPDGDGIPTSIEIWLGCNPHDADSDGDGLIDIREIDLGTDPNKADTDGDGLNDKREIDLHCNPLKRDTDDDGIDDGIDPAPLVKVTLVVEDGGAPVRVGTPVHGVLTCTGGVTGAKISWDDGGASSGTSGVDTSHTYTVPGVYRVDGACTDTTSGTQHKQYQYVVVYDPNGGFVTGGGWINSPAGALASSPSWSGKSNFGFVAKYKKDALVPDGETEFQAGSLNFHSTGYSWLVTSGSDTQGYTAQFKGTGQIKGSAETFTFQVELFDGAKTRQADGFRIRITNAAGETVYDNGSRQPLGDGSIVVHG